MTDEDPQPKRRRRNTPDTPPPAQGSVAKGAILVAVAVLIGFVLIRDDGIRTQSSAVGADIGVEVDDPGDTPPDDTTDDPTDDSAPDARDPADVRVLVANGTTVAGAGSRFTDTLTAAGYQAAAPTNAIDQAVEATIVYFTGGYEAEARAVAAALGSSSDSVMALPTAPVVNDYALANVVVVVGADMANT